MLKIHFFNVAEGDSILLEYEKDNEIFRVLIDAGRKYLPESSGSLRHTADYYLQKLNISYIDALVITHFHVDHVEDLPVIMKTVRFGSIYSTYFPPDPSRRVDGIDSPQKAVRSLPMDLNTVAECTQMAEKNGTKKILVSNDTQIPTGTPELNILIRMPADHSLAFQNDVYDRLFSGALVPEEYIYRASKSRNSNSLRLLVRYAGRSIALDGDYYARDAEKEEQIPCDVLKVGHHGDRKSMSEKLAAMLRPKYAVISCKREYDAEKDRPSKTAVDLLRKYGAEIFYTDCFAEEGKKAVCHEEVLMMIDENGMIIIPENSG